MAYLIMLNDEIEPLDSLVGLGKIFLWLIGAAGFGNYLNDLTDIQDDAIAGKSNAAAKHSPFISTLLLVTLGSMALMPWVLPRFQWLPFTIALVHLLCFVMYSVRPFRFKERGMPGIIMDALYAHVLPAWMSISVMVSEPEWYHFRSHQVFLGMLGAWAFSLGLRGILGHQIEDFENDKKSGTTTFVTRIGKKRAVSMLRGLFLPVEFFCFAGMWVFIDISYWWMTVGLMAFMPYKFILMKWVWKMDLEKHYQIPLFNAYFSNFYEQWMPVLVLVFLGIMDPWYWILLLIHLFLFRETVSRLYNEWKSLFGFIFKR